MSGYRPANFGVRELVTPEVYAARGERAWELLDPFALRTLQSLRDKFGPVTINNWHIGGSYKESGLRGFGSATGAMWSQHKYGRAFDCKIKGVTPKEACEYILAHMSEFPYLTVLENPAETPSWLHFDTRNHNKNGIWIVNP